MSASCSISPESRRSASVGFFSNRLTLAGDLGTLGGKADPFSGTLLRGLALFILAARFSLGTQAGQLFTIGTRADGLLGSLRKRLQ